MQRARGLRQIDDRFDMKGSTWNRVASKKERQKPHPVPKDQVRLRAGEPTAGEWWEEGRVGVVGGREGGRAATRSDVGSASHRARRVRARVGH